MFQFESKVPRCREQGKTIAADEVHRQLARVIFPHMTSLFAYSDSTNQVRPIHSMNSNLLHSKSTYLNVNLI